MLFEPGKLFRINRSVGFSCYAVSKSKHLDSLIQEYLQGLRTYYHYQKTNNLVIRAISVGGGVTHYVEFLGEDGNLYVAKANDHLVGTRFYGETEASIEFLESNHG